MTYTGKLMRDDLGSGVWILQTDDGKKLMLDGVVPNALEGERVAVDGSKGNAMGIGMTGDGVVAVKGIKKA